MSFLAPALLIGLLAAAIPPIIHLLFRRKPKVVRFPALEFIRRSKKKTMRRFRMRQILLMLVRSLLMALLAFAIARPFLKSAADPAEAAAGVSDGTVVFVVDASWSMGWTDGEARLIDRARFKVENLLDQFTGQAAVVLAHDRVEVPVGEPTGDFAAIRKAVSELEPGQRAGLLSRAVSRAYDLVDEAPPGPRRVVVLTTAAGAASALPAPPPPTAGQPTIELIPVDVAEGAPVPNRAILDVTLRPAPTLGAGRWRVDARVANYADEPVRRLPVRLEVDGRVAVRGFMDLAAGEEGTKTFYTRLDARAATPAAVVLDPDALVADDVRRFWLQPAPRIRVLALNGDPRPTPYADELFYFERALAPDTAAGARVELTVMAADVFEQAELSDYDVVVLANPGELAPARGRALEAFVRAGGGLLIAMGDKVRPVALNASLGPVLPRTLRDVRTAGDAAAVAEGGDRRSGRLADFERGHPVLKPFSDPAATLGRARIARYMLLDPAPDAGGEVVMAVEGAPYLLTRALDRGRVALLTGSLDRAWGDLPIRPAFLPLLQQVIRYLTRVAEMDTAPVIVGRPAPVPVEDPRVRRVRIKAPDGTSHLLERPQAGDAPWIFEATDLPGFYEVEPDPPLPGLVALPGFAVAVDPAGSDLRGAPVQAPKGPEDDRVRAALGGARRTELWHAALFGLFVLLLAEGGLLLRRRRSRSAL